MLQKATRLLKRISRTEHAVVAYRCRRRLCIMFTLFILSTPPKHFLLERLDPPDTCSIQKHTFHVAVNSSPSKYIPCIYYHPDERQCMFEDAPCGTSRHVTELLEDAEVLRDGAAPHVNPRDETHDDGDTCSIQKHAFYVAVTSGLPSISHVYTTTPVNVSTCMRTPHAAHAVPPRPNVEKRTIRRRRPRPRPQLGRRYEKPWPSPRPRRQIELNTQHVLTDVPGNCALYLLEFSSSP